MPRNINKSMVLFYCKYLLKKIVSSGHVVFAALNWFYLACLRAKMVLWTIKVADPWLIRSVLSGCTVIDYFLVQDISKQQVFSLILQNLMTCCVANSAIWTIFDKAGLCLKWGKITCKHWNWTTQIQTTLLPCSC